MKIKKLFKICVALAVVLALCAGSSFVTMKLMIRYCEANYKDARWRYAVGDVLCIGDSLTDGTCFAPGLDGKSINERYPYYLGRMLNAEVEIASKGGYSASDWYEKFDSSYDYSDYDTVIIWLGTNYGPTNTLETDVLAYDDPDKYAETETGYFCRLIESIYEENPDCLIVLLNVFASKSDVAETNLAIENISKHYDLLLVDMSDMGADTHPEYHVWLENPHFGKTGNIAVAARITDALEEYFSQFRYRCEFGVSELAETKS